MRLVALPQDPVPPFEGCVFADPHTVVGVERRPDGYRVHRCTVPAEGSVVCREHAPLRDVLRFVKVISPTPGAAGLIALRVGPAFRLPYLFTGEAGGLEPIPLRARVTGDVLDYDPEAIRWGFESRYRSSLHPDAEEVVYAQRKIAGRWFAIVAAPRVPRTLAESSPAGWSVRLHPSVAVPEDAPEPRETWLSATSGERYQTFVFAGPHSKPERIVLWWHGGPGENVSPRFNPYFHELTRRGFTVWAINYPGSTGRGAAYEMRFTRAALLDCLDAVWTGLRAAGARTVVSWSVSTGNVLQTTLLAADRGRFPVSAIVDQVGKGRTRILELAAARGVPIYTIRGRYDRIAPIDRVDHWYAGGHDVTTPEDFAELFDAITPFLAGAPAIEIGGS